MNESGWGPLIDSWGPLLGCGGPESVLDSPLPHVFQADLYYQVIVVIVVSYSVVSDSL